MTVRLRPCKWPQEGISERAGNTTTWRRADRQLGADVTKGARRSWINRRSITSEQQYGHGGGLLAAPQNGIRGSSDYGSQVILESSMSRFARTLLFEMCSNSGAPTGLMVLYTGSGLPDYCSAMTRDPLPACGHVIDRGFASKVQWALRSNPSIHDGAIMCGRETAKKKYRVTGWSYRLYPPVFDGPSFPNKGSAFNSGLAMSCVESVDRVLFWSSGKGWCFERGCVLGPVER